MASNLCYVHDVLNLDRNIYFLYDVTHNTGVTFTFWTPYVSFVFITRIVSKETTSAIYHCKH